MDNAHIKLAVCLWLLFSVSVEAALTVTARGASSNNTSQTTLDVVPNATVAVGSLGVIVLATDNSGTGGATKIFTQASFNDSVGNTWTRRIDAVYDPAGANAGVEIAAYTSLIGTAITTSDNVTFTLSTNTVGKTAYFIEVTGSTGVPTYSTGAALSDGLTSGQNGTAVSVTSSSITSGNVVVGWSGAESSTAVSAYDSDTTNGNWSSGAGVSVNAPMRCDTQTKVTTGTGTQTWNITLGATADWNCGWLEITEVAATSIKTVCDLTYASVKTSVDLAAASVKTWMDLQ